MRRISNSEIQVWKQCRRKWWLQYKRRLKFKRESPVGAMPLGTRVHTVLADHYTNHINADGLIDYEGNAGPLALHDRLVTADLVAFPELEDRIRKEADLSRAMLEGYFEWVQDTGADEGLRVVAPEQVLQYEFKHLGAILQGKLDLQVVREEDGALMVLDHKTAQNFTDQARILPMDEQSRTYLLLRQLSGNTARRIDGVIFNMLRKVKRTARATPPFYDRFEVRVNDHVLENFLQRLMAEMGDILEADGLSRARSRKELYPSPTRDCSWKCPFFGVCPLMDDPSTGYGESLIEALYEEGDPYARYDEESHSA